MTEDRDVEQDLATVELWLPDEDPKTGESYPEGYDALARIAARLATAERAWKELSKWYEVRTEDFRAEQARADAAERDLAEARAALDTAEDDAIEARRAARVQLQRAEAAERDLAEARAAYQQELATFEPVLAVARQERDEARAALERLVNAPGYNESTENHNASRAARALLARGGQP
jgi:chromosome segregation ATPase